MDGCDLWDALAKVGPGLSGEIDRIAEAGLRPALQDVSRGKAKARDFPKVLNDPVWGTIELKPWEVVLLDSPLLQRLRGIRQLGMAHLVYSGAGHDRLEHSCGVVEAAQRIITSLGHNAGNRRAFGSDRDQHVPDPTDLDVASSRLGALLHDVGHSPFSHATEPVVRERFAEEFGRVEGVLRQQFDGVMNVQTSETVAVLMVLSPAMRALLEHRDFEACTEKSNLAQAIAARLLGSRSHLTATYLSGVISGPLDADKIDYMARDSHHAGLPLGLDITRLISKLEVVTVTVTNAPGPELRKRAEAEKHKQFYEVGISHAGLGAYEQMVIGRVILYDRLYYHHKVRAAEAMVRRLVALAEAERLRPYPIEAFYAGLSDDETIAVIGGKLAHSTVQSGASGSTALGEALRSRRIYFRAYAFASRFIAGLDGLPKESATDTRALRWTQVSRVVSDRAASAELERAIFDKAREIGAALPQFKAVSDDLSPEHILVDLPSNKLVARGGDILTKTESGNISTPNLFFDPERWSEAYTHQKQCGYVFAPEEPIELVSLATRIVFFERFGLTMGREADHLSKTSRFNFSDPVRSLGDRGICSADCVEMLTSSKPALALIDKDDIKLSDAVRNAYPSFAGELASAFKDALPAGMPASLQRNTVDALAHLVTYLENTNGDGRFVAQTGLKERDLQQDLRKFLEARGVPLQEGTEVGGGETDLILHRNILVENKLAGKTASPFDDKYDLQAGRYRIALCSTVGFIVVAYHPKDENSVLPLNKQVLVRPAVRKHEEAAVVWVAVPYGHPRPSEVKKPPESVGG